MTTGYALAIKRLYGQGIVRVAARHNLREIAAEIGVDGHIDPARIADNFTLRGPGTANGVAYLAKSLMDAAGVAKCRKTAVMALELLFTLPAAAAIDPRQYFEQATTWAEQHFGVPVLSCVVHLDEGAPHAHALLLPLVAGRMGGSDLHGGKAKLWAMQTDFHTRVGAQYGFARQTPTKRHSTAARLAGMAMLRDCFQTNTALSDAAINILLKPHAKDPEPLLVALGFAMPAPKAHAKGSFVAMMTAPCKPEPRNPIGKARRNPIGIAVLEAEPESQPYTCVGIAFPTASFPSQSEPQPSASNQPVSESADQVRASNKPASSGTAQPSAAPAQQASSRPAAQQLRPASGTDDDHTANPAPASDQQRERSTSAAEQDSTDTGNPASATSAARGQNRTDPLAISQPADNPAKLPDWPMAPGTTASPGKTGITELSPVCSSIDPVRDEVVNRHPTAHRQPSAGAAPLVASTNPSASHAPRKQAAKPGVASATTPVTGTAMAPARVDQPQPSAIIERFDDTGLPVSPAQNRAPTADQQAAQHPQQDTGPATTTPTKRATAKRQAKTVSASTKRTVAKDRAGMTSTAQHRAASEQPASIEQSTTSPADQVATAKMRKRTSPAPSKRAKTPTSAPAAPRTGKRKPATCPPTAAPSMPAAPSAVPTSSKTAAPGPASVSTSTPERTAMTHQPASTMPAPNGQLQAASLAQEQHQAAGPELVSASSAAPGPLATSPAAPGTVLAARRNTAKTEVRTASAAGQDEHTSHQREVCKPEFSRFDIETNQPDGKRRLGRAGQSKAQRARSTSSTAPASIKPGKSRNKEDADQPNEIRTAAKPARTKTQRTRSTASKRAPSADSKARDKGTPARSSSTAAPANMASIDSEHLAPGSMPMTSATAAGPRQVEQQDQQPTDENGHHATTTTEPHPMPAYDQNDSATARHVTPADIAEHARCLPSAQAIEQAPPQGGASTGTDLRPLQGEQVQQPADDDYQRQRDEDQPAEHWDSDCGEFVTAPATPARRTTAARHGWDAMSNASSMLQALLEDRPSPADIALDSIRAVTGWH